MSVRSVFTSKYTIYTLTLVSILFTTTAFWIGFYTVGTLASGTCLGLLYLSARGHDRLVSIHDTKMTSTQNKSVTTVVLFLFSSAVFASRTSYLEVSIYSLVLITVGAFLIFGAILFFHQPTPLALGLIGLLFTTLLLSIQFPFPKWFIRGDAWAHIYQSVIPILETGQTTGVNTYAKFPAHYVYVASTSLVTDWRVPTAYTFLNIFVWVGMVPVMFMFGRQFLATRGALLVSGLFAVNPYLIGWAVQADQMSYVAPLQLVTVLTAILTVHRDKRFLVVFIPALVASVFTHHLSNVLILALVGSIVVISAWERIRGTHQIAGSILVITALTVIVFITQNLMYSERFANQFLFIVIDYLSTGFGGGGTVSGSPFASLSVPVLLYNAASAGLFIFLATIGYFKRQPRSDPLLNYIYLWSISLGVLIVVGFFLSASGEYGRIKPNRLFGYLNLFSIVFLAGVGFTYLAQSTKRETLISLLVVALVFLSITSTLIHPRVGLVRENSMATQASHTPEVAEVEDWLSVHASNETVVRISDERYDDSTYRALKLSSIQYCNDNQFKDISRHIVLYSGYSATRGETISQSAGNQLAGARIVLTRGWEGQFDRQSHRVHSTNMSMVYYPTSRRKCE